jgi:RNA polymerase sigma factor (sigma-70 family)
VKRPGIPLEAIEAVYRRRVDDFFRFALAKTGDPERARDAVQEGFARAIRGRATFHGTGQLEAWVARCVTNAAHDLTRALSRMQVEPQDVAADSMTASDDGGSVIRDAVRRLPRRQRDALFLRYYLDFDHRAIAEALDVEVGTVSATLHAARNSSRTHCRRYHDECPLS